MIMQWRTKGQEHEANWQGQHFKLAQVFSAKDGWRWHLWVDGQHVKQNWQTPKQAMESIDAEQGKVIMAAAARLAVERGTQGVVDHDYHAHTNATDKATWRSLRGGPHAKSA